MCRGGLIGYPVILRSKNTFWKSPSVVSKTGVGVSKAMKKAHVLERFQFQWS